MRRFATLLFFAAACLQAQIPEGFQSIFNGRNIAGWRTSLTNHHGDTKEWRVFEGALIGKQDRADNGGILLSDEKYEDFEVYLEINPDFGCDGGLFLRSNDNGQAYQVMLDYLEGGNMGGIYGERLSGVERKASEGWEKVWKKNDWNAIRARITGETPAIQVWMNGVLITDFKDTANHLPGGATAGMVAVQVHGGKRCKPGLAHRFRHIAIKKLSD